jgi:hypothetical protein
MLFTRSADVLAISCNILKFIFIYVFLYHPSFICQARSWKRRRQSSTCWGHVYVATWSSSFSRSRQRRDGVGGGGRTATPAAEWRSSFPAHYSTGGNLPERKSRVAGTSIDLGSFCEHIADRVSVAAVNVVAKFCWTMSVIWFFDLFVIGPLEIDTCQISEVDTWGLQYV